MAEKTIDQLEYIALPEDLSTVRVPINVNGQTVRTNIEDLVAKIKLQTFSRNIGEIVPSILPLNDAMLHLLDGGIISSIGVYSAFATYLNTFVVEYPNLFCDEATWQSINTTYGQCAKFVIDDVADTIRLPKITEYIKGVSSLSELGTVLGAGLPNITGAFTQGNSYGDTHGAPESLSGVFYKTSNFSSRVFQQSGNSSNSCAGLGFNASLSNSIYGNSDTVTPNTAKAALYLVLGNIVKSDIIVDIDQVMTDLNGKADVDGSNFPITPSSAPTTDYQTANKKYIDDNIASDNYLDLTVNASDTTYTAPYNGKYVARMSTSAASQFLWLLNLGTSGTQYIGGFQTYSNNSTQVLQMEIPVKAGDIVNLGYTGTITVWRFVYNKNKQ